MKYRTTVKITGWAFRNGGVRWKRMPKMVKQQIEVLMNTFGIYGPVSDVQWTGRGVVRKRYQS